MTATATIARGGTSVEFTLQAEGAGVPLVARTIGKPEIRLQTSGSPDPRAIDQWSGQENYNLRGVLTGASAYSDAITLADLVKTPNGDNELTLDLSFPEFDSGIPVVPAAGQDQALQLTYAAGVRDYVEINIQLTRVSQTVNSVGQTTSTPTSGGTGPLRIANGSQTVDIVEGAKVTRGVGRPQDVVRRAPGASYPTHIAKFKSAFDGFDISFSLTDNTVANVDKLVSMFSNQLGRGGLTLDFQGQYGMGSFDVVPSGTSALRQVRPSAEAGTSNIPTLSLRRITT